MSNWIADLLVQRPDLVSLPVHNRDRFSIHFRRPDGLIEAYFTGSPCHFQDMDGSWQPLDTRLLEVSGGFYCVPGLSYFLHVDGRVRIGKFHHQIELPGKPIGRVDGDKIIRDFPGGQHVMFAMENGYREEIILTKPFASKFFIPKQSGILSSSFSQQPMLSVDSKGQEFVFLGDPFAFDAWLESAAYPVIIDPDFLDGTSDGYVEGSDATYATCHSTSASKNDAAIYLKVGQATSYLIDRACLKFDTSSIGAGSTVTQVNMKMVCTTDISSTDFDVQIVKYDWSASDPLSAGNRETVYDGIIAATADDNIWRNTIGISINIQYSSGNLNTSWVNKTAWTYYGLRSSRDYSSTTPTNSEVIQIASQDHTTSAYRPVLTVAYSAGSAFIPKIIII